MLGTQKIIFKDGELIPVADDVEGEEPPFIVNEKGYVVLYHPGRKYWISAHKVVDTYYNGPKAKNIVIHHKDFNKQNNRIDNLVRMDKVEHFLYHSRIMKERWASGEFAGDKHPGLGKKRSRKARENISAGLKFFYSQHPGIMSGENHWNYGGHPSEQTRAKLVESHLGYHPTEEQIEKARKSNMGRKRTPEQRAKIREAVVKAFEEQNIASKISASKKGVRPSADAVAHMCEGQRRRWDNEPPGSEYRKKMAQRSSNVMTKLWDTPDFRKWMKVINGHPLSEEHKAKISESKKGIPLPEERCRENSEMQKRLWQDPDYRAKMSEIHRQQWQDPAYRERMTDAIRRGDANKCPMTDEERRRAGESAKKRWQNPEFRAQMVDAAKKRWADPVYREHVAKAKHPMTDEERHAISERVKKQWQDNRERMIMAQRRNRP